MTPLDAARRLAEYTTRQRRMICMICKQPFAEGERGHAPDCPLLAMPRIVAALEAAQKLVRATEMDPGCTVCARSFVEDPHGQGCEWQALVAALKEPA